MVGTEDIFYVTVFSVLLACLSSQSCGIHDQSVPSVKVPVRGTFERQSKDYIWRHRSNKVLGMVEGQKGTWQTRLEDIGKSNHHGALEGSYTNTGKPLGFKLQNVHCSGGWMTGSKNRNWPIGSVLLWHWWNTRHGVLPLSFVSRGDDETSSEKRSWQDSLVDWVSMTGKGKTAFCAVGLRDRVCSRPQHLWYCF